MLAFQIELYAHHRSVHRFGDGDQSDFVPLRLPEKLTSMYLPNVKLDCILGRTVWFILITYFVVVVALLNAMPCPAFIPN